MVTPDDDELLREWSMPEQFFKPGENAFLASDCPTYSYSAVFEDDGKTGYFHAIDRAGPGQMILDAVHVYKRCEPVGPRPHLDPIDCLVK